MDFATQLYLVTHDRYQYGDFTTLETIQPRGYYLYVSKYDNNGKIVKGVFDDLSYGLMLASVLLIAAMFSKLQSGSFVAFLIKIVATFLKQDSGINLQKLGNTLGTFYVFICLAFGFLSSMYYSVIISFLIAKSPSLKIESLYELAEKYTHLKIYVDIPSNNYIETSDYSEALVPRLI